MSMKHWWNNDREKQDLDINQNQRHSVHHKSRVDWNGIEHRPSWQEAANNCLSHGTSHLQCFWWKKGKQGIVTSSPDLNPHNWYFWLWGNLKAKVYSNNPCNKDNLEVVRMLCFNFSVQWQSCLLGVMHACELKEVTSRA